MFGTDEFGNTRLLPLTFVLVFTALSFGAIATSETMWNAPDVVPAGAAY